jgi:hypothetical protein
MERTPEELGHAAVVELWCKRLTEHGSSVEIANMFGVTVEALWGRAVTTLGVVTLTAIAERVLSTATGRYPFLSALNARPNGNARWRQQAHERLALVPRSQLLEGFRFAVLELLAVIGRLTAEILSEELHAAVTEIATGPASTQRSSDARRPAAFDTLPGVEADKASS